MTSTEFSNQFDVLYNNITSNQAPGLNEYEKSVFLTKAQDEIIKNYFNPKSNRKQDGYDDTPKRQIDFSNITVSKGYTSTDLLSPAFDGHSNTQSIKLPSEAMMVINESATVSRGGDTVNLVVVPISYDNYDTLMNKPFKRPLKFQAWRIISATKGQSDIVIGPNDTLQEYHVRYVKKPHPILTGPLDGLSINGYEYPIPNANPPQDEDKICTGCELDESIHDEILQRAVELAKIAWQGDIQATMVSGERSE